MQRDYGAWDSPRLYKRMEYLWFGYSGRPLIMFPTSGGRFSENDDFHLTGSLADKVDAGELQLVCVDSVDNESWYNKSIHPADRVRRHVQYDDYLRNEMVPYIQHRSGRGDLMAYGASFGAFHASNFAARYPDVISRAVLFSGVYDIHSFLDGYWDDDCYFHCPVAYIPNLDDQAASRLAQNSWVVATGEHDSLVDQNRHFAGMLSSKGIPVYSEFWQGQFGHDWPWWRDHLRRFV